MFEDRTPLRPTELIEQKTGDFQAPKQGVLAGISVVEIPIPPTRARRHERASRIAVCAWDVRQVAKFEARSGALSGGVDGVTV